jgi:hypothetical protein
MMAGEGNLGLEAGDFLLETKFLPALCFGV